MRILKTVLFTGLLVAIVYGVVYAGFISEITEMTFPSEVLECDMPVMVWFYYSETVDVRDPYGDGVDNYAKKNIARIKTLKMDSKYNVITAQKYKVTKNNTFIVFIEGEEKARTTSIRCEKDLATFVNSCVPPLEEKRK